jgi:hypothetical protein
MWLQFFHLLNPLSIGTGEDRDRNLYFSWEN